MKTGRPKGEPKAKVADFAHRLDLVKLATVQLAAGSELTDDCRSIVYRLLMELIEGYDARGFLGVRPARGAPSSTGVLLQHMAVHYWRDRSADQSRSAKSIRIDVASAWGVKHTFVGNMATKYRRFARTILDSGMSDEMVTYMIEKTASDYREIHRK